MSIWHSIKETNTITEDLRNSIKDLLETEDYEYACVEECNTPFNVSVFYGYWQGLQYLNDVFDIDPIDGFIRISSGDRFDIDPIDGFIRISFGDRLYVYGQFDALHLIARRQI